MNIRHFLSCCCACIFLSLACGLASADDGKVILQFAPDSDLAGYKTDSASVKVVKTDHGSALELTTKPDVDYPGVHLVKTGSSIDLSAYSAVEVLLTNTSDAKQSVSVRIDNPGDWKTNPWNSEVIHGLEPGRTTKLRVTFGRSWGNPGFKLDPAKISDIIVFTGKSAAPRTLLIHEIKAIPATTATGTPAPQTTAPAPGVPVTGNNLIDVTAKEPDAKFIPTSGQVTYATASDGLTVSIAAGSEGYPGLRIAPKAAAAWDLSNFGHINAKVTNTSSKDMLIALRVDNDGEWKDNPWNTEQTYLKPGASANIKLIFGYHYGHKPGYKLKSNAVSQVMFFTGKVAADASFRIDSLTVGGPAGEKPAVDPNSIRTQPVNGYLFGNNIKFDAEKQLIARDGAVAAIKGNDIQLDFPAGKTKALAIVKPAVGKWNLAGFLEVHVNVKNVGQSSVTVRASLDAQGGPTEWGESQSIAPGQSADVITSFFPSSQWNGAVKNSGARAESDGVNSLRVNVKETDKDASLLVQSIRAVMPVANVPEWLGKRPPVEGDWVKTFDENFDKPIDYKVWNIYTNNFWDKRSHFTKDNIIVENGKALLRYTKTTGHDNDDPTAKTTDYAVGYLDTYGKWVQRYGYFEARVKLPDADGLWPAFWMMPDRGADVGPQWKRADTKFGGMEFDILEHLSRWRNGRYNIAFHYDGYQKEHKALGTSNVYIAPDKDGYIACGLLWLPGQAIIYANGVEVGRWDNERISNVPSYLILYMVSGGWANNSIVDSQLPQDFIVDYVRCWQRKDLASDADGFKNPQSKWELGSWSPIDSRYPPKEEPKPE